MSDNSQDMEATLSVILKDNFSAPMNKLNEELKTTLLVLAEVSKKLGSLENINLQKLTNEIKNVKDAAVSINTPTRRVNVAKNSGISDGAIESLIKAEVGAERVQNALGRKKIKHYEQELSNEIKKLENRATELEQRLDKAKREANLEADTKAKESRAALNNAKAKVLNESGQVQYTGGFAGGVASILGGANSRFRNKQGITGFAQRLGARLAENEESWFGKAFGKNRGLNNSFGGFIKKGTVNGLGLNLGGVALGGFVSALSVAGKAVGKFSSEALAAYGQMQKLSVNLGVVYGSKTQSEEAFSQIQTYATRSPFGIEQTTEMAILLKQSGVYASELQDTLEMIGDVSGGNEEKMRRIANNYAQIQAIGHANMLDMRQFAYAGLPIYEEVAKTMKVSQSELRSIIQQGKVSAEIMEQTFKRMTNEGGTFYKAVNKGAQTYAAKKINLEDIKSIEKSKAGDFIWNFGGSNGQDSIAQNLLKFKEDWHKGWTSIYQYFALEKKTDISKSYNNLYLSLVRAYELALKNNNKPLADELAQSVSEFKSAFYGEDEIRADFTKKAMNKLKIDGKTIVADETVQGYQEKLSIFMAKAISDLRGYDENTGAVILQGISDLAKKQVEREHYSSKGLSGAEKAYADSLISSLNSIIGRSKLEERLDKLSESAKDAHLAFAYIKTDVEKLATSYKDSQNKIAGKTDSISSLHASYKEAYKNSPLGKLEEEKEKRRQYDQYVRDFNKAKRMVNTEKSEINVDHINSAEDLKFLLDSGFIENVITINIADSDISSRPEDWDKLLSNLDKLPKLLPKIGYKENSRLYNLVNELVTKYKDSKPDEATGKKINKDIRDILRRYKFEKDEDTGLMAKRLIQSTLTTFDSSNLKSPIPFVEATGSSFYALWKRIISSVTGQAVNTIDSSSNAFDIYTNQVIPRKNAKDIVSLMLKNNYSLKDVSTLYEKSEVQKKLKGTNSYTEQVDWRKTNDNIEKFAMSIRTTTDYIDAYRNGLKEQYDTLAQLTNLSINTTENQDIENTGILSADTVGKVLDLGGQFVNAFSPFLQNGELKNKEGKVVGSIKNGVAYGENGEKLDNQSLVFEDKLLTLINAYLPKIYGKITEANKAALQTGILAKETEELKNTVISNSLLLAKLKNPYYSELVDDNNGLITSYAEENLGAKLKELLPSKFADKIPTIEDINNAILDGSLTTEDIRKSIIDAIDTIANSNKLQQALSGKGNEARKASELDFVNQVMGLENDKKSHIRGIDKYILDLAGLQNIDFKSIDYDELNTGRIQTRNKIAEMSSNIGSYNFRDEDKNFLKNAGATEDQVATITDPNADLADRIIMLDEIKSLNGDITEEALKQKIAYGNIDNAISNFKESVKQASIAAAKESFVAPFQEVGKALVTGSLSAEDLAANIKNITAGLMSQVGAAMTTCGFQIAGNAAAIQNWGLVAAGLGLAAAGGVASGAGSALSALGSSEGTDNTYEKEAEDRVAKLESLKSDLLDILKQAKEDANYYENNLRHKKALSLNQSLGADVKVNDAIITPSGNVISTHPDDYLIATKTPQTLVGTGSVAPKVNFKFIDKSTGIRIASQKEEYNERTNSIDLSIEIENKISEFISTSKGDDAFNARAIRLNGMSYTG